MQPSSSDRAALMRILGRSNRTRERFTIRSDQLKHDRPIRPAEIQLAA